MEEIEDDVLQSEGVVELEELLEEEGRDVDVSVVIVAHHGSDEHGHLVMLQSS